MSPLFHLSTLQAFSALREAYFTFTVFLLAPEKTQHSSFVQFTLS